MWFSQDDCLKVTKKERNTIYIFDLFEGEAFDHIAGLGCRILGPMSILTSVALNKVGAQDFTDQNTGTI